MGILNSISKAVSKALTSKPEIYQRTSVMPDNHMNHPYMQEKATSQKVEHNGIRKMEWKPNPNSPENYQKAMKGKISNGIGVGY